MIIGGDVSTIQRVQSYGRCMMYGMAGVHCFVKGTILAATRQVAVGEEELV